MRLRSADALDPPLLDPAFGASAADVATLRAGIRLSREIANQPAFDAVRGEETWPGPGVTSDAALDDYIAHTLQCAAQIEPERERRFNLGPISASLGPIHWALRSGPSLDPQP